MWLKIFILLLFRLGKRIKKPLRLLCLCQKYLTFFDRLVPLPKGCHIERSALGGTPIEIVRASRGVPHLAIFYLHGGAFVLGLNNIYRKFSCVLAKAFGAQIILVDYSLLPQHPFPFALNQSLNAYEELLKTTDPASIIVAGDSAGGNLVLSMLLAAKEKHLPMPAGAAIFSGWLNLGIRNHTNKSINEKDPFIREEHLSSIASLYLSSHINADLPFVSPIDGNLEGLPPLFMQVGTKEMLLEDTVICAEKAKKQGVKVHLEICHDMYHVQPILFPEQRGSRALINKIAHFMKQSTAIGR